MPRLDMNSSVCLPSPYSNSVENLKYLGILTYSIPGILVSCRLLYVICVSYGKIYRGQPFFVLFSMDLVNSLLHLIIEILINRPNIYIPQLCPILSQFYRNHTLLIDFIYPLTLYIKNLKMGIQSILSVNRMTCVLIPTQHGAFWKDTLPFWVMVLLIYPFGIIWNVIISEKGLMSNFGGFSWGYNKVVEWASLSLFSTFSLLITLTIITSSSVTTIYQLSTLQNRIVQTERMLCLSTMWTNLSFVLIGIAQMNFLFFPDSEWAGFYYVVNDVSYDVLDIGCNSSYPVVPENVKYFLQLAYLAPGGFLQARICWVLWISQWKVYSKSSFFRIWAMDSSVSLIQLLIDTFFSRIHIYFPQFCKSFSIFLEIHWLLPHIIYPVYLYTFTAKTVIHSVLSVNRMTCVIIPMRYAQIWSRHMSKVTFLILIYPFFLLWNVIISEKYLDYVFGGFVISYKKQVPWASLSRFQILSFCITLSTTLITTAITLWKMSKLKKRLLSNERHLCLATAWISIGFVIAVIAQAHFAWFREDSEWSQVFYIVQCVSFDLLNVGSPIIILTASRPLRAHVLHLNPPSAQQQHQQQRVSTSNSITTKL